MQLSSTRQLVYNKKETGFNFKNDKLLMYGGVNYGGDDYPFSFLPGTLSEVKVIDSVFVNHNGVCTLVVGENATESNFKTRINKECPQMLHISSHVFSNPIIERKKNTTHFSLNKGAEESYLVSEDPMYRCGIAFEGANNAWTGNAVFNNDNDGILTAYEIGNLWLGDTKIAVLSACQTGLGDVKRGLKMAGVETLVLSLWEVSDAATSLMMKTFYQNLLNGEERHLAFKNAQNTVRNAPEFKQHPYFWSAFVMID